MAWPQPAHASGNLLFLTGRGDFIEKYLEALSHWHAAGWDIAGFDWRGQGGSGRLLADRLICHQIDFDVLLNDLQQFVAQWRLTTNGPHVIVAHSMGAHLALRLLARVDSIVDVAVFTSPMIGIRAKAMPGWLIGLLAGAAARIGLAERRLWGRDLGDVGGRMTSCPDRRDDKAWWKAARPDIASGAPSWGWVDAACRSIARLGMHDLAAVNIPMLLFAARTDPVIDVRAIIRAAAFLPGAKLSLLDKAGHELLRETDALRIPILQEIDAFLNSALKGGPHA